jgi:hypothetical protein
MRNVVQWQLTLGVNDSQWHTVFVLDFRAMMPPPLRICLRPALTLVLDNSVASRRRQLSTSYINLYCYGRAIASLYSERHFRSESRHHDVSNTKLPRRSGLSTAAIKRPSLPSCSCWPYNPYSSLLNTNCILTVFVHKDEPP